MFITYLYESTKTSYKAVADYPYCGWQKPHYIILSLNELDVLIWLDDDLAPV